MPIDMILPISMVIAFINWYLIFRWYFGPVLNARSFEAAMRPLLLLHGFRYIGLMFLVPGVTAEALDLRFAWPAAYGDFVAALLALAAIAALRFDWRVGLATVLIFNFWGSTDLINAVARGILFTPDGALGATFWIPALIVPLLLVTHVYIFGRLFTEVRAWRFGGAPLNRTNTTGT